MRKNGSLRKELNLFNGVALVIAFIFVLRKRCPDMERPYEVWGYPIMPAFALLLTLAVLAAIFVESPINAVGILVPALGWLLSHLYFKKMENQDYHPPSTIKGEPL